MICRRELPSADVIRHVRGVRIGIIEVATRRAQVQPAPGRIGPHEERGEICLRLRRERREEGIHFIHLRRDFADIAIVPAVRRAGGCRGMPQRRVLVSRLRIDAARRQAASIRAKLVGYGWADAGAATGVRSARRSRWRCRAPSGGCLQRWSSRIFTVRPAEPAPPSRVDGKP
jgi:hypothetical protein